MTGLNDRGHTIGQPHPSATSLKRSSKGAALQRLPPVIIKGGVTALGQERKFISDCFPRSPNLAKQVLDLTFESD